MRLKNQKNNLINLINPCKKRAGIYPPSLKLWRTGMIYMIILLLITAGIVRYVNYLMDKPLDIDIPTHFTYNNTKIALVWTDDNTGENLIIQSDKKEYNGFSSVDVYFSITNINRRDQDMDVVVWVGSEKVRVEGMERLDAEGNGQSPLVIASPQAKQSREQQQSADHGIASSLHSTSFRFAPRNDKIRKSINGFTTGYSINDEIKSGNTNYYKATIKYPPMSKGEFFIEAFGYPLSLRGARMSVANERRRSNPVDNPVIASPPHNVAGQDPAKQSHEQRQSANHGIASSFRSASLHSIPRNDKVAAYGHLDPWYSSDWKYKRKIILNSSRVATTTDAFPVLATTTLADLKTTTNGGKVGNDNGYDIVFVDDDDSTVLDYEREYYASTTGEIAYWIKTDISSTTDKTIYMYYGSSASSDQATTTGVWDDNFVMVNHLAHDGVATTTYPDFLDSTKYDNDGSSKNMNSDDLVDGQIDGSLDFDGGDDYVDCSNDNSLNAVGYDSFTVSYWLFDPVAGDSHERQFYKRYSWFIADSGTANQMVIGTYYDFNDQDVIFNNIIDYGVWTNVVVVFEDTTDRATFKIYKNGGLETGDALSSGYLLGVGTDELWIGGRSDGTSDFTGKIDEVRISNVARTAGWIETEYNNQVSVGDFMTFGEEKPRPAEIGQAVSGLSNGLVGHWKFSEGSGSTVADSSGNGNTGTWSGSGDHWTAEGKFGSGGEFDGVGDYVGAGDVYNGVKTIAFWIKADDITSRPILDMDGTDYIETDGSGNILATDFPDSKIYIDGTVSTLITSDWHFIVITDNTGVNGSAVNIGKVSASYFDGLIDEIRFYSRVLSQREIAQLYNNTKPTAEWHFRNNYNDKGGWCSLNNSCKNLSAGGSGNYWTSGFLEEATTALSLGGAGFASLADDPVFDIASSADFSLIATLKTADTGNVAIISKRTDSAAGSAGWLFGVDYGQGDGIPYFEVSDGTNEFSVYGSESVSGNLWQTVGVVFDESSAAGCKIYIDGQDKTGGTSGTIASVGSLANAVALNVGRTNDGNGLFTGEIDRIGFFPFAMTQDDILRESAGGHIVKIGHVESSPSTGSGYDPFGGQAPVAWWKLDEMSGSVAADYASSSLDGTWNGSGSATWHANGKIGYAGQFNGSDDYVDVTDNDVLDATAVTIEAWVKSDTVGRYIVAKDPPAEIPNLKLQITNKSQIQNYNDQNVFKQGLDNPKVQQADFGVNQKTLQDAEFSERGGEQGSRTLYPVKDTDRVSINGASTGALLSSHRHDCNYNIGNKDRQTNKNIFINDEDVFAGFLNGNRIPLIDTCLQDSIFKNFVKFLGVDNYKDNFKQKKETFSCEKDSLSASSANMVSAFSAVIHPNSSITYKNSLSTPSLAKSGAQSSIKDKDNKKAALVDRAGLEPAFPRVNNHGAYRLAERPMQSGLLDDNYNIQNILKQKIKKAIDFVKDGGKKALSWFGAAIITEDEFKEIYKNVYGYDLVPWQKADGTDMSPLVAVLDDNNEQVIKPNNKPLLKRSNLIPQWEQEFNNNKEKGELNKVLEELKDNTPSKFNLALSGKLFFAGVINKFFNAITEIVLAAVEVSDTFTEASDTALESHTPDTGTGWTEVIDVDTCTLYISSNTLFGWISGTTGFCGASDGALCQEDTALSSANYEVSVLQGNGDTLDDTNILACRIQNASNMYAVEWNEAGSDLYVRTTAGGWVALDTAGGGIADGSTVKLICNGTSISVEDDDVEILSATDSSHTAAGKAGVGLGAVITAVDDVSSQYLDDFTVNILPAGKSDVPYAISTVGGGQFLIMNSGTTYTATSTTDINDNQWHHIVGSYDGTTMKIYIDGNLEDTNTDFSGNLPTNDGNVRIGADYQATPDNFFSGLIDDVKIYNYARTAAQIAWDYNKGKPAGHWKFDEASTGSAQGATLIDSSGNGNAGTGNDGANDSGLNWATGKINYGIDFDGTDDYVDIGDTNYNINTISFWMKADSLTESIIDLDNGTHTASSTSGTISANGFASPTIYVDGSLGSTIDTGWHHITLITDTAIDANNMDIGRVGANYFDGIIDDVRIYGYERTADQVREDYNAGARVRFGN